jgi:hypothetical protein
LPAKTLPLFVNLCGAAVIPQPNRPGDAGYRFAR